MMLALVSATFFRVSAQQKLYYEKHVAFLPEATAEEKLDMASRLTPTPQQIEWQQMELTAFLHFGINTFTGREWGDGSEDPKLFNPTELDCDQWVRALKDAGFKMAILTAKHHDGFCLWPTKTTQHSVASSPWKDGKGDVVRDLREACQKYGLKFGVYLSPWDRNASCYGDSPAYNKFFIEQLTELLTQYGEVHEVWFDGANGEGPNGKKQVYDWESILSTIRHLQPKAVTAIMGDDVRWVGNEKGLGRETEWSATALTPGCYTRSAQQNKALSLFPKAKDLGGREIVTRATELFWYPSEVDVSIRPGWFYHAEQDNQVKSLSHLADIYFKSVGYNSVLLLNIPPDRRGLIHENDVQRLKELSEYLNATFAHSYLKKGQKAWQGAAGSTHEYKVEKNALVNTFMIQEDISKGQRVESFLIEGYQNGQWKYLAEGTTVGYKRMVRFSDASPERIRVTLRSTRNEANIASAGLFYAKPLAGNDKEVQLSDIPTDDWRIVGGTPDARKAIDSNRKTAWQASSLTPLVVDMGREVQVKGFSYAPTTSEDLTGTIYKYAFYTSLDGKTWTACEENGEFSNIMHNPVPYFVRFGKTYKARYFKLVPLAEINGKECVTIGEVGILVEKDLALNDETQVYDRPGAPIDVSLGLTSSISPGTASAVKPGANHPKRKGWFFFTAHEFLDRDTRNRLPLGFIEHRGQHMSRAARVDNARCSEVSDGVLHIHAQEEADSIDNLFPDFITFLRHHIAHNDNQ
ncbi:MAG: alpha-L-fucosidase, partial [Bacteroides sp.]|nr:alpha-L-fucosidase [Bacteroides sp.]